jgi:hypothetical protein
LTGEWDDETSHHSDFAGFIDNDDLQGSSRITGGIFRGKAVGNMPAFVDFESTSLDPVEQDKGRVLLYVGDGTTPFSVQHPIGSSLPSVLQGLAKVYSPIKRMNSRICVEEDGVWSLKGHFNNAVRTTEGLPWALDDQGKWSVTLQADVQSAEPQTSDRVSTLLPSVLPADDSESWQKQMVSLLGIPETLTGRSKTTDLRLAYAKYKGIHRAQSELQRMTSNGTWTLGKVSMDSLIELFVSKSVYYGSYNQLFPKAVKYKPLAQWLENAPDAPDGADAFGEDKVSYGFKDLKKRVDQMEVHMAKKKRKLEKEGDSSKKRKRIKTFDEEDVLM